MTVELEYPEHGHDGIDEHEGEEEANASDLNQMVSSDEMYMSESYGYNFSVNSDAMEQFDHVEDVEPIDE